MITFLDGPNFSGRSDWLESYAARHPWPYATLLSNSGESALTGLSMSIREELSLDAHSLSPVDMQWEFAEGLDLLPLYDRPFHVLSGGELVRCAIGSALVQGVQDILIDTALEQFDSSWRKIVLGAFSRGRFAETANFLVADNRLSDEERKAGLVIPFQKKGHLDAAAPTLSAKTCSEWIKEVSCRATLTSLAFRYGRGLPYLFEDVSLELKPGELYELSGKNGSGKTTLLRLLSGTVLPVRGEIRFDGELFDPRKRTRFVALAFQNPDYQFSRRTVGGELENAFAAQSSERAEPLDLLSAGGLTPQLAEANPYDIPFVFKKRLSNLIAALSDKPIVAFDEPTLGQDEEYRSAFVDFLRALIGCGRTVLLISHDEQLLDRLPSKTTLQIGERAIRAQNRQRPDADGSGVL